MSHNTISDSSYVHPQVLVDTEWLQDHLQDQRLRVAEVDYDASANYELGHIPSVVLIDWKNDINDPMKRNMISRALYENPLQRIGVRNDIVIVLYRDFDNWFAAFAFWVLKYYGYEQVMLLNGGT